MECVFELPQLKLQGGNQTRWESSRDATNVLLRIMPAVLADLSKQARSEPTAEGLYRFFRHEFFPPTLCLMHVVHNKLHRQFQVFQMRNLFFSRVEQEVTALISSLRNPRTQALVKDKWESWLSDESGLQPLLDEVPAYFKDGVWDRFSATVMIPFLDMLLQNVESRFPEMGILGNFNVLAPRRIQEGIMDTKFGQQEMQSLARHFPRLKEEDLLIEWEAFQEQAMLPDLKSKTLEEVLKWLISPNAMELFPHLSLAAAIALAAPVQNADVERLFSALKLVKTPLRNRLTDCHLDVCCRVAIDGPQPGTFRMDNFVRRFYRSNSIRRVKCSKEGCELCK
ncbi:uncharacterized protein LOC115586617 [Sparus aurata]|uniref:uncharacterized protein LOC115586617 n=1 Tax=Sparus aurata TaxID=8175 RepID=UPI0011C18BCD|nr:uncharacterized protein LOC115586617 [Sparus aurata]XP_030281647.1 uncharacterized protein LOC115586617 [Sparus aurata]XP_030281655.1 uncharacterized protein LOC115586617 [Sparus aurata]XP_030281663.1 uncharacterized protein LOC115586617 [Sparus aurata]XP_030281673.1 uncharacterized protein LOC115586617 [Sparus aurata]